MAAPVFVDIGGAGAQSYVLTEQDAGHLVRVLVTAELGGRTATVASLPIGPVQKGGPPVFALTVLNKTALTITVGWTPPAGAVGYRFYRDGKPVSSSYDPTKSRVTFSSVPGAVYRVDVLGLLDTGSVTA